jgi:hypothetical protein
MPFITDDTKPHLEAEQFFIDKVLHYSRMFENSTVSIQEILELPYFLFDSLIRAQEKLKEKERKFIEEERNRNKGRRGM